MHAQSSLHPKKGNCPMFGKALCMIGFHEWDDWKYQSSDTCNQSHTCIRCGKNTSQVQHNWGEWEIQKPSSPDEPCQKQRRCSRCDATEIKNRPHQWEQIDSTTDSDSESVSGHGAAYDKYIGERMTTTTTITYKCVVCGIGKTDSSTDVSYT
jgi:hypothetical protein